MKKYWILCPLFAFSLLSAENTMPEHKKYYISGIEFDTQVYCADFADAIKAQAQKIKILEAEIARLRQEQQTLLSEKLEAEHQKELEKAEKLKQNTPSKSKIIISNKPI